MVDGCREGKWVKRSKWLDGVNSLIKILQITRINWLDNKMANWQFALALQHNKQATYTMLVTMISMLVSHNQCKCILP
jgi:hypothetical protein